MLRWVGLALVGAAAVPAAAQAMTVQVVNRSGRPAGRVYLTLSGGSSSDGQLADDRPVRLSAIRGGRFTVGDLAGARIYVAFGAGVTNSTPASGAPTRYDKVELTTTGAAPAANLTAVDFFAISFRLDTLNAAGRIIGTRTEAPARTIFRALSRIPGARRATQRRHGQILRILSPTLSPASYPSMTPYVRSMAGQQITLRGAYYGTPFTTYAYRGTFAQDGSITLTGTTTPQGGRAQAGQSLSVRGSDLAAAIYPGAGPYTVGGQPHSANDLYGAIDRDLMAGFAWGYWGGRYGNDTLRWCAHPDPRGYCPDGWSKPAFAAARAHRPAFTAFNPYAAVIARKTDAYGFAYSDTGAQGPLLPLAHAATLRLTIRGDRRSRG